MTNKIYLFYPVTIMGRIITFVTRSRFSHAAVEYNGVLYDSSETRGDFGVSSVDLSMRKYKCFEVDGDLKSWYNRMYGTKYDWKGIVGWVFGFHSKSRFYCFEAAWDAMYDIGLVKEQHPDRVSGADILYVFIENTEFTIEDQ